MADDKPWLSSQRMRLGLTVAAAAAAGLAYVYYTRRSVHAEEPPPGKAKLPSPSSDVKADEPSRTAATPEAPQEPKPQAPKPAPTRAPKPHPPMDLRTPIEEVLAVLQEPDDEAQLLAALDLARRQSGFYALHTAYRSSGILGRLLRLTDPQAQPPAVTAAAFGSLVNFATVPDNFPSMGVRGGYATSALVAHAHRAVEAAAASNAPAAVLEAAVPALRVLKNLCAHGQSLPAVTQNPAVLASVTAAVQQAMQQGRGMSALVDAGVGVLSNLAVEASEVAKVARGGGVLLVDMLPKRTTPTTAAAGAGAGTGAGEASVFTPSCVSQETLARAITALAHIVARPAAMEALGAQHCVRMTEAALVLLDAARLEAGQTASTLKPLVPVPSHAVAKAAGALLQQVATAHPPSKVVVERYAAAVGEAV